MAFWEHDSAPASDGDDIDRLVSGFDTVRRGFAPDQVAEYLKRVATNVLSLESRLEATRTELLETRRERDEARASLETSAGPDPYASVSQGVTELVRSFDEQVEGLHRETEVEAERVLAEVRTEAERILSQARDEAARIIAEARAEAERAVAETRTAEQESRMRAGRLILEARQEADRAEMDLTRLRQTTLDTFRDIRERTLTALGEVEAVIERGASDAVVVVDDADELASTDGPPRPDL